MKSNYLPKDLPFLPGNSYADPTIQNYHKNQLLSVGSVAGSANTICEKTVSLQDNVDPDLLRTMKDGPYVEPSLAPSRKQHANDAIPAIAPKWLKYDRQVLKFYAYFQEPVVEDANENFRIRKCIIFYYLDDDTIHIIEHRVENSGIP